MNRSFPTLLLVLCFVVGGSRGYAADLPYANPFFVFEDGLGSGSPEQEAALAQEAGFTGISFDEARLVPERLKAMDAHGLQFFFLYLSVNISGTEPVYEPGFEEAIAQLKGRGAIVWLTLRGNGPRAEELAVAATQRAADLAAASNLRVAIYPHFGFYVQNLADAIRIANKAARSNLGYTFNLCHELRSGRERIDLEMLLSGGIDRLYAVSINGADADGDEWNTLIQPLDQGSFDVAALVQKLIAKGYRGPIGLQCYAIKGDPKTNLTHSMAAWQRLSGQTVRVSSLP